MTGRDTFVLFVFLFCALVCAIHVSESSYGYATFMGWLALLNLVNLSIRE
jgi:hypothetical protein